MDPQTTNTILAVVAIVISVGGTAVGIINHKAIVSRCCGRRMEVSLDINDTRAGLPAPKSPTSEPSPLITVPVPT
jgi:hypothetical protein